jgi:hypothetical protein
MSKLSTCINIMHSFNSFYCMPHMSFLFICIMLFPMKSFFLFGEDEMLQDPFITFMLLSYAKVQAQTLGSLASPPSQML